MRHFFWALLAAPLLLAPVRFQQGAGEILLTPSQATPGPRGNPAVALPSPTIITVSPTRAPLPSVPSPTEATSFPVPAPTATPAAAPSPSQPTAPTPARPATAMTGSQATLCVRALGLVNDLAVVSMEQSGRENLVDLTIATAIAQVQAAQGNWPTLAPLRQAGLPLFTPNRAELKQALSYAISFCQNPATASGGAAGVTRPR